MVFGGDGDGEDEAFCYYYFVRGLHSVCTVFCMGSTQGLYSVLYGVRIG